MKTTIELPDDLYRRAKAEAALRGRRLKDMVEEGLHLVLDRNRPSKGSRPARSPSVLDLMGAAVGAIDSGVTDLGSNPKHMEGFGRGAGDR